MNAVPSATVRDVGFLGAGQLGGPMLERLLESGVAVSLYARRPEVAASWKGKGVRTVASAPELATVSDVVIICVYSDDQVRDVVLGPQGLGEMMRPGTVVVSHTTVGLMTAREIDAVLGAHGVQFVDAPVSGTADHIRRGELTVLLGGESAVLDDVDPLLAAYCSSRLRTGGAGTATAMKLINNLWFAANVQLAGAAIGLGTSLGVDERMLQDCISQCSANSAALGYLRQFGSLDSFAEQFGGYLRKDVIAVQETAAASRVDLGLLGAIASTGPVEAIRP